MGSLVHKEISLLQELYIWGAKDKGTGNNVITPSKEGEIGFVQCCPRLRGKKFEDWQAKRIVGSYYIRSKDVSKYNSLFFLKKKLCLFFE